MNFFRALYWGLAYTSGIATMTLLWFLQSRSKSSVHRKLMAALAATALSVVALTLMEASQGSILLAFLAGHLASLGATLTTMTFPRYACSLEKNLDNKSAQVLRRFFFWAGGGLGAVWIIIALGDLISWLMAPDNRFLMEAQRWLSLGTFVLLGMAIVASIYLIYLGTAQFYREQPLKGLSIALSLGVSFVALTVLDFMRGVLGFFPWMGQEYLIFPGFYLGLNVFYLTQLWGELVQTLAGDKSQISRPISNPGTLDVSELAVKAALSKREQEVLILLMEGLTYQEIAHKLYVSLATIKTHVGKLYQKTGARNKVELLRLINP